tara:strand:+ start:247 stop:732 length:486 start_codon:yes stop_codon:yes gene_type:complete
MSDRFKSFKPPKKNTFVGGNPPPKKTTNRFDSLTENSNSNKNRFISGNKFSRGRRQVRRSTRDYSNNKVESTIGKFTQVGTGEVSFTPQFKCGNNTQKQRKKEKKEKKEKLNVINKKDEQEDDWNSLQNQEDVALTLAMAQQYQYYTESEEEEEGEEGEED